MRQIGAASPLSKRSRKVTSASTNQLGGGERRQGLHVAVALDPGCEGDNRGECAVELREAPHQLHQFGRFQEHQATGAVVVREGAKGLVAKGDLFTETPRFRGVKGHWRRARHGLIDPAETVNRDLFNKELLDRADLHFFLFDHQRLRRHLASLSSTSLPDRVAPDGSVWQNRLVSQLLPSAPSPTAAPIPIGTTVTLDQHARLLDRNLLIGGAPWRLLRLPGGSREVVERWRGGGEVHAGEERFARTLVQQGLLHPRFHGGYDVDVLDVIVPVFNDVDGLRSLLSSLRGLHVTVVDDGSADAATVRDCASEIGAALVRLDENRGPAGARNAGASATSRPLIWFIDADVVLDDPLELLDRLQHHFADPLLSAVAPRVRGAGGASIRDEFEQRFSPLDMGVHSTIVVPGGPVGYVPGACLLIRRTSFGDGFDETLRLGEDVDLVWRLHDQGWLVRYDARAVVTHPARPDWRRWWSQRVGYGTSSGELARRHGRRLAPFRADVWTLIAWANAVAGQPAVASRVVRAAHGRLRSKLAETTDDPDLVAGAVVGRGMVLAGGPLARSAVRTYGPLILLSALHPKVRRRALLVFAVGTAWRWRATKVRPGDVVLGVADDLAYGLGVYRGVWRSRSLDAIKPHVTKSSLGLREMLGLRPREEPGDR